MNEYYWLQSPNQSDFGIFYIKFCNNFVMTLESISCLYCLIWQIDLALSFAVQFQFSPKILCFRIVQKSKMVLLLALFGNLAILGKNSNHFLSSIFHFCLNRRIFEKIRILTIFFYKSCPRICKNDLTEKLHTIWDKYQ